MKAITPRQQDRRDRILECTRQQVARLGYDGVNMRELALEADVSTATLYNLFNSKDDLILAASQELLTGINEHANQSGSRGVSYFLSRAELVADTIVENPNYAEAMGRMLFAAEASAPVVKLLIGQSRVQIERCLREMLEDGELQPEVEIEKLARNLAGVSWSVNLLWMKGFIALHDFKEESVGTSLSMLLPWLVPDVAATYRSVAGLTR